MVTGDTDADETQILRSRGPWSAEERDVTDGDNKVSFVL